MTGDELRSLIEEEALQKRIRELLEEPPPEPRISLFLRHPLLHLVTGIVLTWLLGTQLTNHLDAQRRAREQALETERAELAAGMATVREFSRLVGDRHARSRLLLKAVRDGLPPEEIASRRLEYERAVAEWERSYYANLFSVRSVLRASTFHPLEAIIRQEFEPRFSAFDDRVASAARMGASAPGAADLEELDHASLVVSECGGAIVDRLYRVIMERRGAEGFGRESTAPGGLRRVLSAFLGSKEDAEPSMPGMDQGAIEELRMVCRGELL